MVEIGCQDSGTQFRGGLNELNDEIILEINKLARDLILMDFRDVTISGQWPIVLVLVPLVHNSINRGDGHDQCITVYLLSFIPDKTHLLQTLGRVTHTIYTSRWLLYLKKVCLYLDLSICM